MRLSQYQRIFSKNVAKLILFAYDNGIELTFGEAYRTREQQLIYLESGKSRTMKSNHLRRLAVDFNFFVDNELTYNWQIVKQVGDYWETLHPNNRWGGDWNKNEIKDGFIDTPHFEMNV